MRYFAMTDDENIVDLGECDDFNDAFEREPLNAHWVFSEDRLQRLVDRATAALLRKWD